MRDGPGSPRLSRRLAALALAALLTTSVVAGSGNYLIVTAQDYDGSAPLTQFINHKTALGFTVSTYVVPPGTSRDAIKDHIEGLYYDPLNKPQYVLIVGDTSGSSATSNTIPHWVGQGTRHGTTDLPYACMDAGDDWYPNMFIGRFSATSPGMLQILVDKTILVESGNFSDPEYVKRAAFLATSDSVAQANASHDHVISTYFDDAEFDCTRIYQNQGGGTSDITNAVNAGSLFTVYMGHSSSGGWWGPSFDQGDIQNLSNDGLYGLAMGWSCNTAHFDYDECAGETWVREANKGAAAFLSASNYIWWNTVEDWESSRRMEDYFFNAIFVRGLWEVGPAWQSALYQLLADPDYGPTHEHTRNIFEEFVLLGDPALQLPQGDDTFTVGATPGALQLCCPPETEAQYAITVGQVGAFAESVILSVDGYPDGATMHLTTTVGLPPFTSTLTISGLDGVDVDDYDITITGTSTSIERTAIVTLMVMRGAPGDVVLDYPANGAEGVALLPTLRWTPTAGAMEYDLELDTDPGFGDPVFTCSTSGTSCTVGTPLGMVTPYYWRVRARSDCGDGAFSTPFSFTTVYMLMPATYDLLNGESGSYTYYDDDYNGNGNNSQPLAPLSDGLGDLTNGVIATQHWNGSNLPYVGWKSIEPTITFHFAEHIRLDGITLHVDDSGGGGGVVPPSDIVLVMGGTTLSFEVTDPGGNAPFAIQLVDLNLTGTSVDVTLEDDNFSNSRYMMLSEVQFYGGPDTGACCVGYECSIATEEECGALKGEYQGDGTECQSDTCGTFEPECLIISEVVYGAMSGGCPKWIEITNAGQHDFFFNAGGIIIQTGDSTDVTVDVDLTGETILAGQAYAINTVQGGACGGGYQYIYQSDPDFETEVAFGDGTDRYILTDTADGSNLLDIYGEFGVDGAGQVWEYTEGYAYRLPAHNSGSGQSFDAAQWHFGGPGSLSDGNPELLLTKLTTPHFHAYNNTCYPSVDPGDLDCDGDVDFDDIDPFVLALGGQATYEAQYPDCNWYNADCDGSGDVDFDDIDAFVALIGG